MILGYMKFTKLVLSGRLGVETAKFELHTIGEKGEKAKREKG